MISTTVGIDYNSSWWLGPGGGGGGGGGGVNQIDYTS